MINYMSADLEKEKVATFMKRNYSFYSTSISRNTEHVDNIEYKRR